jgi:hypothetical protein
MGYTAEPVERWVPMANCRRDLFHCIDLIAVCPRRHMGCLGVQSTTLTHVAGRLAKARKRPELRAFLLARNLFQVHGWYQKAGKWRVKVVALEAEQVDPIVLVPRVSRKERARGQPLLFGE